MTRPAVPPLGVLHADGVDLAATSLTGRAVCAGIRRPLRPAGRRLLERAPLPLVDGLPGSDDNLSWADTAAHLTGGLAALQVGPAARNLAGARPPRERRLACVTAAEPERRQYPAPQQAGSGGGQTLSPVG